MKFINYLTSIADVEIYPMISMLLFVSVFSYVLWRTFRESKESITEQKNIPLQ
jgi:Ca2+/Na+ antiporter